MEPKINFSSFTVAETNLILAALGKMPYETVHELMHRLHREAMEQVSAAPPEMKKDNDEVVPVREPIN